MTTPRKNWFEKHQGLITFFGYLITAIVAGLAFNLNSQQFQHQRMQDSSNDSSNAQNVRESKKQSQHQDSLNKHQNEINEEELNAFKSQASTAKEQLKYFKQQTQIAETQLKNANLAYQNQLNVNKPSFVIQDYKIDSNIDNSIITINYKLYNSGGREAYIKKIYAIIWKPENSMIRFINTPAGDSLLPTTHMPGALLIHAEINTNDIIMFEIFYKDILSKQFEIFRIFTRFNSIKPTAAVQVDDGIKDEFILRVRQKEIVDNKKYLSD